MNTRQAMSAARRGVCGGGVEHAPDPHDRRWGTRGGLEIAALIAFAGLIPSHALAQDRHWLPSADGSWGTPSNWSSGDVPDSSSENAFLDAAGSYRVRLESSVAIGALSMPNSAAVLDIFAGNQLRLAANSSNESTITLNPAAAGADTFLTIGSSLSLQGAGRVVLNAYAGNLNTANILPYTGAETLRNGPSHRISGCGAVAVALVNDGSILADQAGRMLLLYAAAKTNNGTIGASDGGTLLLSTAVAQAPGGRVSAQGGIVRFDVGSLSGGELTSSAGGGVVVTASSLLDGVHTSATLDVNPGTALSLAGAGIVNDGRITLNPSAAGADTFLTVRSTQSISGTGEVVLNAYAGNLNTANIVPYTGAETLTNAAGHTLRGCGAIAVALVNRGEVRADQPSRTLQLYSAPKINEGIISASGQGVLLINGALSQSASAKVIADNARVTLHAASLVGGELAALNAGRFEVVASSNIQSLAIRGPLDVLPGNTLSMSGDAIVNDSTMLINTAAAGADTFLRLASNVALLGSGSVVLNAYAGNLNTANIVPYTGPERLTQGASHSIRGSGAIGAALTNNGLVAADAPGRFLLLFDQPKINNAVIAARDGGVLRVACTIDQDAGARLLADGSIVELAGATIRGGAIEAAGAGRVVVIAASTLSSTRNVAPIDINTGTVLALSGSDFTNSGAILVNPSASGADTIVRLTSNLRLLGDGSLRLNAFTGNYNTGKIDGYTGTESLTNGPGHTITGRGYIATPLLNQGVIAPGHPGSPGTIIGPSAFTNASTGRLEFEVFGPADADWIPTTAPIALDGTLRVRYAGAYAGHAGATLTLLRGASIAGRFAVEDVPRHARVIYTATEVRLLDACWADLDDGSSAGVPDGGVTIDDLLFFLRAFEDGSLAADLDDGSMTGTPDEGVTIDDLVFFLVRFEAGC